MRIAILACPALLSTACGEVIAPGTDGGSASMSDASIPPDARADAPDAETPACTWSALSAALLVNVNTLDREDSATLTGDGLGLFFTRSVGKAGPAIYVAGRESRDAPFTAARPVDELAGVAGEFDIEISSSGLEFLVSDTTTEDIFSAARSSRESSFGEVTPTGMTGFSPTLSGAGLDVYILDEDFLWHTTREAYGDPWVLRGVMVGLSPPYRWIDVSADRLDILMSGGPGGSDEPAIAITSRADLEQSFGAPASAGEALQGSREMALGKASWDGSGTQMVVTGRVAGEPGDLYLSTCE